MSFYSLGWGRREAGGGGDRLPPSPPPGTGRARGQGHRVTQHPRSYSAGTRPNVRRDQHRRVSPYVSFRKSSPRNLERALSAERNPRKQRRVSLGQHTMNFVDDFLKSDRVHCSAVKWHTKSSLQLKKVL